MGESPSQTNLWVQRLQKWFERATSWHGPPSVWKYLSLFLLATGIIFYLGWNILYQKWTDPGVYSVSVVLIGIGITGTWLYMDQEVREDSGKQVEKAP